MPIIITSKKHLFRRCGVAHPAQATEYPDGQFTEAQLESLKSDPMLTVSITVDVECAGLPARNCGGEPPHSDASESERPDDPEPGEQIQPSDLPPVITAKKKGR